MSATLEELRTVTTHDDNMEKQYKESQSLRSLNSEKCVFHLSLLLFAAVSQNIHLQSSLDNAHREIRVSKIHYLVEQRCTDQVCYLVLYLSSAELERKTLSTTGVSVVI